MKNNKRWYRFGIAVCGLCMVFFSPLRAEASAGGQAMGPLTDDGVAYVPSGSADIYVSMDSWDILKTASAGESFDISGTAGGEWLEICVGDGVGYVSSQQVEICGRQDLETVLQDLEAVRQEAEAQARLEAADALRQHVVDFALQFVGCRYVYGGTDPHTGVDCSGFTRYVMQNAAGVYLERTSGSQACQGAAVGADQVLPGDLVFYGEGGRVNHVAIYIGNGQVVHASTEKTGVKISNWAYRPPLRIARVLGN